jgi:WD40 repeat protein
LQRIFRFSTHTLTAHRERVTAIVPFKWDAQHGVVLSVSHDGTIRQWATMATGPKSDGGFKQNGADTSTGSPINCVDTLGDRPLALTGHWDGALRLIDLARGARVGVWRGHESAVRALVFTLGGRQAVSVDLMGTVRVWSTAQGVTVGTYTHRAGVTALMPVADGAFMSAANDGTVSVSWIHISTF